MQGGGTVPDTPTGPDAVLPPGEALRKARLEHGMSLRGLARLLDVSPATLSAVENGRRDMTLSRAARAAQLLGARAEDLRPTASGDVSGVAAVPPTAPRTVPSTGPEPLTDWRGFAPLQLDQPLTAALEAFLEFGYHGATMRDIARRAGLSVPGVYHYYASKQDMLVAILDVTMADLLARTTAARAEGRDPVERFALLVECRRCTTPTGASSGSSARARCAASFPPSASGWPRHGERSSAWSTTRSSRRAARARSGSSGRTRRVGPW
jgi:DNA-binding XRE family transcriptional regulator